MNLKAGLNRPVQSRAVNWATAGLIVPPPCRYYEHEYVPVVINSYTPGPCNVMPGLSLQNP